jgi:hypothetical protein
VNQTLCFPGAILLLDGKTLKSRHLVGTLFFLPREAEAATIRFEASAHGDINAGASFGGTPVTVVLIEAAMPHALPDHVLASNPEIKLYKFTKVDDQVVLVDPTKMRMIAVIDSEGQGLGTYFVRSDQSSPHRRIEVVP